MLEIVSKRLHRVSLHFIGRPSAFPSNVRSHFLDCAFFLGHHSGEYGDVNLHYRPDRQPLKLHSLIVSRSPTIAALLQHPHSAQQPLDIFLPLNGYDQVTDGKWRYISHLVPVCLATPAHIYLLAYRVG